MNNYGKQLRTIMRCLVSDSVHEREVARAELRKMLYEEYSTAAMDLDELIADTLLELGVPDNLVGHKYLAAAIRLVVDNNAVAVMDIYHQIADYFGTSWNKAERGIRYAIEVCWERMSYNTMRACFGNAVDSYAGKPSNTAFIYRVANMVRKRMKEAA